MGVRTDHTVATFNLVGYEKVFGHRPSESKKTLTMYHPTDDGSGEEKRWIFKIENGETVPPEAKIATMFTETIMEHTTLRMSRDRHFYADQAWNTFAALNNERDTPNMKSAVMLSIEGEKARLRNEGKDIPGDDHSPTAVDPGEDSAVAVAEAAGCANATAAQVLSSM